MTKLILTVGAPASGKSTWAKAYCMENRSAQVERDIIRRNHELPFGTDESKVTEIHRSAIINGLEMGWDVVVSDLNLSPKNRRSLLQFVQERCPGTEVWYKLFTYVDRYVCLVRNAERNPPEYIQTQVIHDLYDNLIDTNKFMKGIPSERIMK